MSDSMLDGCRAIWAFHPTVSDVYFGKSSDMSDTHLTIEGSVLPHLMNFNFNYAIFLYFVIGKRPNMGRGVHYLMLGQVGGPVVNMNELTSAVNP